MKKLLVLSLVLGFASLASAGLVYSVNGETFVEGMTVAGPVTLSAVMGESGKAYTLQVTVDGDLTLDTSATEFPGNGSTWMFGNKFVDGTVTETAARLTGGAFMDVAAGTEAFSGLVVNGTSGTITLEDAITGVVSTITVVPEPATMALLGLGALVLRRKK